MTKRIILAACLGSVALWGGVFALLTGCGGDGGDPPANTHCTEDSDCGSLLMRCVEKVCVGKNCLTTGDCLGNEYCSIKEGQTRGLCTVVPTTCADDAICPAGFHCMSDGCKSAACQGDSDCRKDERCDKTVALCKVVPPVCTQGETRCRGNTLEACKTGGTDTLDWRFVKDCETTCEVTANVAACAVLLDGDTEEEVAQVCEPLFTRCNAQNAIETCKSDGSAWAVSDPCTQGTCDDSQEPAVCKTSQICDPKGPERKCADNLLSVLICNSTGTAWLTTQCQSQQSCKVQGGVPQCLSSSLCTGNRYRCNSNSLEKCKTDGSAWDLVENCGTGTCQVSNPVNGEYTQGNCKRQQVCTPITAKRCNGTRAEHCNYDGTGWSLTSDCAQSDPVKTCQDGACI